MVIADRRILPVICGMSICHCLPAIRHAESQAHAFRFGQVHQRGVNGQFRKWIAIVIPEPAADGFLCRVNEGLTAIWIATEVFLTDAGDKIEDAASVFFVTNNRLMTDINIGTTTDGYSFDLSQACGNILTGLNGVAATVPFAVISE